MELISDEILCGSEGGRRIRATRWKASEDFRGTQSLEFFVHVLSTFLAIFHHLPIGSFSEGPLPATLWTLEACISCMRSRCRRKLELLCLSMVY